MRPPIVASIATLAAALIVASFSVGRFAERRARQQSNIRAEPNSAAIAANSNLHLLTDSQNDHVLVANVAAVSFNELWDVVRGASSDKREEWAREIEQMPAGPRKTAALESFYKVWVELDPVAAIHEVESIHDKRLQRSALSVLEGSAADSALPAIAELEFRSGDEPISSNPTYVLTRWSAVDPKEVSRFLEKHPHASTADFLEVTFSWANTEPEKAGEWVVNLKLEPWRNPRYPRAPDRRRLSATRGLLHGWLDKDRRGAAAYVSAHADDPDMKEALAEFGAGLCARSREDAATFIRSLPNEETQRAALSEILDHVGGVITMTEGGDEEEPKEPEVVREELPIWLVTLPPNLWIDHAGKILKCWDETDSSSAESWLHALPEEARAKAIIDYSAAASAENARRIFELTTLIPETDERRDAFRKFVDNLGNDISERRAKIAELSLTDEQKQTLLRLASQHE